MRISNKKLEGMFKDIKKYKKRLVRKNKKLLMSGKIIEYNMNAQKLSGIAYVMQRLEELTNTRKAKTK